MLIKDLYKDNKTVVSFEIFPPKKEYPVSTIYNTIEDLGDLKPDFISVTYGSGGGNRDRTVEIASIVKNKYDIECLAHLTCITATAEETDNVLSRLSENGISNILALRGDLPEGFEMKKDSPFRYAGDLVEYAARKEEFSIGAAAYAEGHIECKDLNRDIEFLKGKVDRGVDFLITQLFFDNELFYRFMDRAAAEGINIPVSAGIMPVLNKNQIKKMVELSGASLPGKFIRMLDRYEHNPDALREAGIAYATEQIIDLVSWGVPGIHLYTMNKAEVAKGIISNITEIRAVSGIV